MKREAAVAWWVLGAVACGGTGTGGSFSSSSSSSSSSTSSSSSGSSDSHSSAGSSSSGGIIIGENESCVTDLFTVLECEAGLLCVTVTDENDEPLYGTCKSPCTGGGECPGRTCVLGMFDDGSGFCGTPKHAGETGCEFWEDGDNFCDDPSLPETDGRAYIECLNGTCGYVCDFESNPDAALSCPSGLTCGTTMSTFDGYEEPLATCESASSSSGGTSSSG